MRTHSGLGGAHERLRFLRLDQATVQSAKRVQVAADLDSQRIAQAEVPGAGALQDLGRPARGGYLQLSMSA